jgi:hypothetical protein
MMQVVVWFRFWPLLFILCLENLPYNIVIVASAEEESSETKQRSEKYQN